VTHLSKVNASESEAYEGLFSYGKCGKCSCATLALYVDSKVISDTDKLTLPSNDFKLSYMKRMPCTKR
jgi:hypothetical protein